MKFGRPLAIIVHYTVQFNLECCKTLCRTRALIQFRKFKNLKIIIRRLESEIKKIQHTIIMKFGGPLAIIVHHTVQFNL